MSTENMKQADAVASRTIRTELVELDNLLDRFDNTLDRLLENISPVLLSAIDDVPGEVDKELAVNRSQVAEDINTSNERLLSYLRRLGELVDHIDL